MSTPLCLSQDQVNAAIRIAMIFESQKYEHCHRHLHLLANKIQSIYRGYKTRRRLTSIRMNITKEESYQQLKDISALKVWRGYRSRKYMFNTKQFKATIKQSKQIGELLYRSYVDPDYLPMISLGNKRPVDQQSQNSSESDICICSNNKEYEEEESCIRNLVNSIKCSEYVSNIIKIVHCTT
ncbi:hypothetical protein GJ496_009580 [Pomphorhynchus laevis]|nr:hypothetical protein GJ496_009580 [Pomphorhynchus laevis]